MVKTGKVFCRVTVAAVVTLPPWASVTTAEHSTTSLGETMVEFSAKVEANGAVVLAFKAAPVVVLVQPNAAVGVSPSISEAVRVQERVFATTGAAGLKAKAEMLGSVLLTVVESEAEAVLP